MNKRFITSVCFVRKYSYDWGKCESRISSSDSFDKQVDFNNKENIKATYLLQYDAFDDCYYREKALKQKNEYGADIGIWFEVVRPLVQKAGIEWRSKNDLLWNFHVNPGFLMSYALEDKKRLIDTYMNEFKDYFGEYPKTVGSWLIDSESMEYMSRKYNTEAFIICREQWGMDGYTLWGGPYYGAYYPCKNNMQCPAQTKEEQINTPVFRMFVNDPIYCYYEYANKKYNDIDCGLFTQEPAWKCGQSEEWVKWHYENIFKDENMGLEYTQLGQESSFAWERVADAYGMQMTYALDNKDKFGYEFVTVAEMGRRFKDMYTETPSNLRFVLDDWAEKGNRSVWFNNKNYRINVFSDKEQVWIRDIHLFDENYQDKYLKAPCSTSGALYDNPPIMDGIRFSSDDTQAGMFFGNGKITDVKKNGDGCEITLTAYEKEIKMQLCEESIAITSSAEFKIEFRATKDCAVFKINEKNIEYNHDGFEYEMLIEKGRTEAEFICSEDKAAVLKFKAK